MVDMNPGPAAREVLTEKRDVHLGLLDIIVPIGGLAVLWYGLVESFDLPSLIGMLNALVCLQQISWNVRRNSGGPVTLTFWAFALVWLCVAPIAQLQAGSLPWPDARLDAYYVGAQLITTVALLSYAVGASFARRKAPGPLIDGGRVHTSQVGVVSYKRMWVPFGIALFLAAPVILLTGGIAGRFATRDEVGSAFAQSGISAAGGDTIQLFFLNRLPAAAALVAAYAAAHYYFQFIRKNQGPKLPAILLAILGILLVVLLANPFSSSRYIAFGAIAAVLLAVIRIDTPGRRITFATISVVGLVVIYPLATWFKRDSVRTSLLRGVPEMFYTVDFDGFQQIVNSMYFVEQHGHTFGQYVVSAFLFFVPRALWEGKAMPASLDVAAARGYDFQNLSMPVWSEFFIDFGILGVVFGLAAFGFVAARLDLAYHRHPFSMSAHLCVLFAVCQFGLLRGPLGAQVVFMGSVIIIGYFVFRNSSVDNLEKSGAI